jgi:hypothetical protein
MNSLLVKLKNISSRLLTRLLFKPFFFMRIFPLSVLCKDFGSTRGIPLDRPLIQNFLGVSCSSAQRVDKVLEFGDNEYSRMYFPKSNSTILRYKEAMPLDFSSEGILTGDLLQKPFILKYFDLIIATQVLAFTANPFIALKNLTSLLKPGGMIVGTEPFLSPISTYDSTRWGDYFRMTSQGLKSLVSYTQELELITVEELGGQKTSLGLIHGYCSQDFKNYPVSTSDNYPTLTGYIARKSDNL